MKFEQLKLVPELLQAIRDQGIETCTDIQEKAIPLVLDGKDVSGLSQTGTGKTFAFLVPIIEKILRSKKPESIDDPELKNRIFPDWKPSHFVLILAPTRELVDQISNVCRKIGTPCGIRSASVIGGVDYEPQKQAIGEGVDIVIGTPGRLLDLYNNHVIHFKHARALVFDEADRMFDMGFKDDMVFVLQRSPQERQILLFSATLNFDVSNTIYRFNSHPIELNVSRDQAKAGDVADEIYHVGDDDKPAFLLSILRREKPRQAIIFSNFKHSVDRITDFLNSNELPAVGISSLLTQAQRDRVINQFKNQNEKNILVATDLAARGLDIKGVDLVINVEMPDDAENYVHRIGRTGRAGEKGKAFSLVGDKDLPALSRIEDYLKNKIQIGWLEDTDLVKDFVPVKSDSGRDSRIRKTGLAAAKDRPPFEQSLRRPRPPRRHDNRDHRDHRGPRPDQANGGQRPQGPRHEGQRHEGQRHEGQRHSGGHENQKPQRHEGHRPDNVHRDRRTRRHSEDQGQQRPGGQGQQQRHGRPDNRPQGKQHHRHKPQGRNVRTSGPRPNAPTQQASAIQKITGFFKKLFE